MRAPDNHVGLVSDDVKGMTADIEKKYGVH